MLVMQEMLPEEIHDKGYCENLLQYSTERTIRQICNACLFMRVHKILNNIQYIFSDIPVLVLYPGTFNSQDLSQFGEFQDVNYYRTFNIL